MLAGCLEVKGGACGVLGGKMRCLRDAWRGDEVLGREFRHSVRCSKGAWRLDEAQSEVLEMCLEER